MQRSKRISSIVAAQKIISRGDAVWIPPKAKDRFGNEVDDDDATLMRDQRGQVQSLKHSAVLNSMDLMVDGAGFLIPRSCKKAVDDTTVDNEICLYSESESESDPDSTSSDDPSSSDEEDEVDPNEVSLSSIPYCRLVPDSCDIGAAPQTPSGHKSRNGKSYGTLETEGMTRSTLDSQSDCFASPCRRSTQLSREIPKSCDVQSSGLDLVSPLPNPSPGSGKPKSKRRISLNKTTRKGSVQPVASPLKESRKKDSFYIPGITVPSRSSSKMSVDSRGSAWSKELSPATPKKPFLAAPVVSTSRISAAAKKVAANPSNSQRSSSQLPSRQSIQRNQSESATDPPKSPKKHSSLVRRVSRVQSDSAKQQQEEYHQQHHNYDGSRHRPSKHGRDRHFVPGRTDEVLQIASPNVIFRKHSTQPSTTITPAMFKSLTKSPSTSARSTSITTRMTLSNSTGRETLDFPSLDMDRMEHTVPLGTSENSGRRRRAAMEAPMKELNRKPTTSTDLDHHFQQETHSSSNSPSRRSKRRSHKEHDGMINQIQALTLVDDHDDRGYSSLGEEVSEAGAVIVPTRKVLKGSSSSRSLRRSQTSSSHRHRSRRESTNP